jgi:hypothetical protein
MTDDRAVWLDLVCPRRAVVYYLATALPLIGLVATFFEAGWNHTPGQTVLSC